MPQQYSRYFKSFGSAPMPMDPDASSSPMDSPLAFEPNTFWDERRELNSLMMNVVSTCLAQKSMVFLYYYSRLTVLNRKIYCVYN